MQADAIPDWAVSILVTPFFPIAGIVHWSLGVLQTAMILAAAVWRAILTRRHPGRKACLFRTVYLPLLFLPNIGVVIWSMINDPAL